MRRRLSQLSTTKLGEIMTSIAFGNLSKLLPIKRIIETEKSVSFYHPFPNYQLHILIVPKKGIKNLHSIKDKDYEYLEDIVSVAQKLIKKLSLEQRYYRIIVNGGSAQKFQQLHLHLISGKEL